MSGRLWTSLPGLPRTRGDGPDVWTALDLAAGASPHTRGWTVATVPVPVLDAGFPAHAGMDLELAVQSVGRERLPRTRGDGPGLSFFQRTPPRASPHTRGWTLRGRRLPRRDGGFPAHAGMDPRSFGTACSPGWLPRTRGDGPVPAGPGRGCRRASPHTRGWTRAGVHVGRHVVGFPAHAGMDPCGASSRSLASRLPRTRGDGPTDADHAMVHVSASPHTRGWTVDPDFVSGMAGGFPAHAGMDPAGPVSGHPIIPTHGH